MAKTFDDYIPEKMPENKPKGHPSVGTPADLLDSMMYEHVRNERNKPHVNVVFNGLVIKTSRLTVEEFRAKYDSSFVMYAGKLINVLGSEESGWQKVETIIEARVYIPEIASCLPQPADVSKFFKEIALTKEKPKPGEEDKELKKQQRKISLTKKEIKQIERYPLAYYVVGAQRSGEKTKLPTEQSIVEIQFPYSFDFSYGVITGVSS